MDSVKNPNPDPRKKIQPATQVLCSLVGSDQGAGIEGGGRGPRDKVDPGSEPGAPGHEEGLEGRVLAEGVPQARYHLQTAARVLQQSPLFEAREFGNSTTMVHFTFTFFYPFD